MRPRKEDMGTESQGFVGSAASSAEAIRQRSGSFRGEDSRGGGDADAAATLVRCPGPAMHLSED